jgi:RNA polymerase sigma-70 factor (ECF subfamily)
VAADPVVGRADVALRAKASPAAQAVESMFERHGERVLAYCRRRLGSPEEAEDALQTTFLYAHRGLQRGVVPETEIAWLLKIAHNVCLSHWDSDRRRRRLELVRAPELIETTTPAAAGSRDDLHALEAALAGLTDLQRRAIVLREWRGLSYAEIAAELELSQSAVETLIFRARRALAAGLEAQDVEGGRTRRRVLRGLDLGGLVAALKSLFGGGGAAKLAGLTVGAAVLAGTIPDVPKQAAADPAPAPSARVATALAPVDPATAPSVRAAFVAAQEPAKAAAKPARAEQRKPKRGKSAPAEQDGGAAQQPTVGGTVGQVTTGLGQTVNGAVGAVTGTVNGTLGTVTQTVNGTVGTVTGTVNGTVGTVNGTVNGTVGTVTGALPQVVAPTLEVVNGVLGGQNGALLP